MNHHSLIPTRDFLYLKVVGLCIYLPSPRVLSPINHLLKGILIAFDYPSLRCHPAFRIIHHSYFNMRCLLFQFFLLFVLASPSLGSPDDYQNIQNVGAQYCILIDKLNWSALDTVFTSNATFDFSNPKVPLLHGIQAIEKTLAALAPPGTVSQHTVSTQHITLSGSDRKTDGATAYTAQALSYTIATYFGTGNLTGQILTFYGEFDDTFVKTSLPGSDGWRVDTRVLRFLVSIES